jgi:hypothetical protein
LPPSGVARHLQIRDGQQLTLFYKAELAKPAPPVPAAPAVRQLAAPGTPGRLFDYLASKQPEARVDLNLEDVPLREALSQIFTQAKQGYRVEEDVPADARVTVRVKGVRLSTAIDLVLPPSGVAMSLQIKDGKPFYRFYKGERAALPLGLAYLPSLLGGLDLKPGGSFSQSIPQLEAFLKAHPDLDLSSLIPYRLNLQEQRSTFHCPNCKGQSTVIRRADQPKCEKCSRTFLPDWQFCPADGAKRPASAGEWRYCPFCGKRVEAEKNASVPVLGDLPIIGRSFRNAVPAAPAAPAPPAVPQPDQPAPPVQ